MMVQAFHAYAPDHIGVMLPCIDAYVARDNARFMSNPQANMSGLLNMVSFVSYTNWLLIFGA